MLLTSDIQDLIRLFQDHGVQFVLVGGFAVNYYGYVRTTQDIDLLILPTEENARRSMAALCDFGFGGAGIPETLLANEGAAVHLGSEPNRIDILTSLVGMSTSDIILGSHRVEVDGVEVPIIAFEHLVAVKQSSKRTRDRADAEELLKIAAQSSNDGSTASD